jgi:tyrosyl-tRNA synthetase
MSDAEKLARLTRGTEDVHSLEELKKKLASGRRLRIKFGVDPTAPDIHLGHTVPLLKLREFQDQGHLAVLIIGDFTASIGDPTGRDTTRPELSPEAIAANARTYQAQAFKILDPDNTEVVFNGKWFNAMTAVDLLTLQRRGNATQMLQRRDFQERREAGKPIAMHELTYPLLQGWDSVVVHADVELGGSEQLFNLLIGRDLQQQMGQEPQVVMTLPILEGIDGVNKMSKSLGNTIAVNDPAEEMFGKTMRISDELMGRWYPTLFAEPLDPALHPMEAKKQLAARIVGRFHDAEAGQAAREAFERVFSQRELPTEIPSFTASENPIGLVKLMQEIGASPSGSEAKRLITQGGVTVGGEKITDPATKIDCANGIVLKCGKRFFARVAAA